MSNSEHHVVLRQEGDVAVLCIGIEHLVDYDVAKELESEMIRALGDRPNPKVVVDMSGLEFLSSVGYAPFINFRAHVRKNSGQLILSSMPTMIREVFEATRLLINPSSPKSLFEYRETVEEAISELGQ